jgi:hypothetical protein
VTFLGRNLPTPLPRPHNFDWTRLPPGQPRFPVNGVLELLRVAGFDAETIEIIYEAYLKTRRPVCDIGKPDPVNEIITLRILSLAKQGERDPDRLRAGALATLSIQPRS